MFYLRDGQLVEDDAIEKTAVDLFKERAKCNPKAPNPNVWGLGWSEKGEKISLYVQGAIEDPCDQKDRILGVEVQVRSAAAEKVYSDAETKVRFRNILPPELLKPEYNSVYPPGQLKEDPFFKTHPSGS